MVREIKFGLLFDCRQRIGQDVFREALMDLWQGRCALTGLALPATLLRASHAKPWAKASDAERLDLFNCLLLAIHLDAMFDTGLVAFADDGRLLYSPHLDAATREHYCLHENLQLHHLAPGHLKYLRWHLEHVFQSSQSP
jgi:putative restriction endonuclease